MNGCSCETGTITYRHPKGHMDVAPVLVRCAEHRTEARAARAAFSARVRYLSTRAVLPAPDAYRIARRANETQP